MGDVHLAYKAPIAVHLLLHKIAGIYCCLLQLFIRSYL